MNRILPLILLALIITACADEDTVTPTTVVTAVPATTVSSTTQPVATQSPAVEPTGTAEPAATDRPPTPTPVPLDTLTICLPAEPQSLYLYGPRDAAAEVVLETVYDGPIDSRSFDFQPIILEKLPALADGDARLTPIEVSSGDWIVDANGSVVRLAEGIMIYPSGCQSAECAVLYAGEPLEMDQLSATFTLLPDLAWSDGVALTAADSVFSYELALAAQAASGGAMGSQGLVPDRVDDTLAKTADYSALDEQSVRWTGLPGFYESHYQTNFFSPLPGHQLAGLSPGDLLIAEESARLPLGWGPFILTEWLPGQQIVADRNPNYFRAVEGLPAVDRVIFRFDLGEPADYLAALQAGECDVLTRSASGSDRELLFQLQEAGQVQIQAAAGPVWERLDFGIASASDYEQPPFFADVRTRQAVAHCIDRQQLATELTGGFSPLLDSYIGPVHPLSVQATVATYEFDRTAAQALLAEVGWRDDDQDGILEAYGVADIADGTPFSVNYVTLPDDFRQAVAAMIAEDLAVCGIASTLIVAESNEAFFANSVDGPVFGRRFDLAQFAWLSGVAPACQLFISENIPRPLTAWTGVNNSGHANPDFDEACLLAQAALPGSAAYEQYHLEALRIFADDMPVLPLLLRTSLAVARIGVTGFVIDPTERPETWNIEEFGIE